MLYIYVCIYNKIQQKSKILYAFLEAYRNICIECPETQRKDLCVFLYGKH